MIKKIFPYLYAFLLFSYFFIGQISLPGLPLNFIQLATLITFAACFSIERPVVDRWMKLYIVFLLFYAMSAMATGFFSIFFHNLYSTLFISFTGFWATSILIRYNQTLKPLIYTLIAVGVIDAIVTALQALGIPFYNPLLAMIIEDTEQEEFLAIHNNELGFAISGLYINPVFNGHFLLFYLLISLLPQSKNLNIKMLPFTFIIMLGLFFCQQRSAFLMGGLALVYVLYNRIKQSGSYRFLMGVMFVVGIYYVGNYAVDYINSSGSRLSETSSTGRAEIWAEAVDFIFANPICGGYELFHKVSKTYSHNLILSSIIAGGFLGGIILLRMVYEQLKFIYRRIRSSRLMVFHIVGITYLALIVDSMLHNTGLVEMDFATFVGWALVSNIMVLNNTDHLS